MAAGFTTIAKVAGEIPSFARGGKIADATIQNWIDSSAQAITGRMMKRGLPLDPAVWPQPDSQTNMPSAADLLERINRLGAAADLAAAIASQFGAAEWGPSKSLERRYLAELKAIEDGGYDKIFLAAAATVEAKPQFGAGDMTDADTGDSSQVFTRGKVL